MGDVQPAVITPSAWRTVTSAARRILEREHLDESLGALTSALPDALPGVDSAGVTMREPGGLITMVAASGDLVRDLYDLQDTLREGPCCEALRAGPGAEDEFVVGSTAVDDPRWPSFAEPARRLGVRSVASLPLRVAGRTLGGLHLVSRTVDPIPASTLGLAGPLQVLAASALDNVQRQANFEAALDSRAVVGQAVGIVMLRYRLDAENAFAYLRRTSSVTNTRLRVVAERLIAQTAEAAGPGGPAETAAGVSRTPRRT